MRHSLLALLLASALLGLASYGSSSVLAVENFSLLPADDDVFWMDTLDNQYLVLAHRDADRITIWDIPTGLELFSIDTPAPACVLARGTKVYVANYAGGVSVYDGAQEWKEVARIKVGAENVSYLSAPGGKAFTGHLLAMCDVEKERKQLALIDTKAKKSMLMGGVDTMSIATVDFDGKGYIIQGTTGSPSRAIRGIKSWPLLLAGRDSPFVDGRYDTLPFLRQIHSSSWWFGGAMLCKGLPPVPVPVSDRSLQFIVGDRAKALAYGLTPENLTALELKGNLKPVEIRQSKFPPEYTRFDGKTHINSRETEMFDFQHVAITMEDKLHLFVYDGLQKQVYSLTTDAFEGDDLRIRPEFPGFASKATKQPPAEGVPRAGGVPPAESKPAAPLRTWSDLTGNFKVEARFGGVIDGKVKLIRADGRETLVPIEKLSPVDQGYLEGLKAQR